MIKMNDVLEITDLERDFIREIVNIGLAKAADSFAVIARDKVMVNVPSVEILDPKEVESVLPENSRTDTVVQSDVKGEVNGKTFILFDENEAARLAEICIGREEDYKGNYSAMKRSLLLETSNILTGAIITQLANILKLHIYGSAPVVVPFALRRSFHDLISDFPVFKPFILTINTRFVNAGQHVELPLVIIFDMDTIEKILVIIRQRSKVGTNWLR
jgi:chemotaxis protein CheC